MKTSFDVAAVFGSLRRESSTRRYVDALVALAPPSLRFDVVPIGELAPYNQDIEETPPAPWVEFRDRVRRSDAVLIATPEYDRSVPGVLKNAIDIGSRPFGTAVRRLLPPE